MAANRTKKMQLTFEQIRQIEAEHGSPVYLLDEDVFRKNYDDIVKAFSSRYERFILAYSYKTNYIPYLCGIIRGKGGWAEVVSRLEYDLALKVGHDPGEIIFNGPVKHYKDIELALKNRSTVNLDSRYEVGHVHKYAKDNPGEQVKVGLRINIGLSDEGGASHIQEKLKVGRFGFDPAGDNIENVVSKLTEDTNVVINGLHGHTSTTDRSIWCYEVITRTLCNIAEKYLAETIEYINIGGGIFGYIPPQMRWTEVPSFDDYAQAVADVLAKSDWVRQRKPILVLEPGVAMVANTLSFVTKVISTKTVAGELFVTVDGSAFDTKPTLHKINQPYEVIRASQMAEKATYNVTGSTCMEKDYLLTEVTGIRPEEGDYIKIDNVGAYTVVLSPPFINAAPPILVQDGDGYRQIRRKQLLAGMFADYLFE